MFVKNMNCSAATCAHFVVVYLTVELRYSTFLEINTFVMLLCCCVAEKPGAATPPAEAPAAAPTKKLDNLFFIEEPKTAHITEKGTATFIAKVGGDPIPSVKWMKGKWRQINHGGRISIEQKGQEAKLEIREVTKSDSGQYRCVASNKHGEIECSTDMHVDEKKEVVQLEGDLRCLLCFVLRTPSKQKSPQEEKDIDIVELLRNVDPKEYEKYARMYGITDYRGLLQAIEQLKKEKAEESGRPVTLCTVSASDVFMSVDHVLNTVVVDRNWNVETERWSGQRSGHSHCFSFTDRTPVCVSVGNVDFRVLILFSFPQPVTFTKPLEDQTVEEEEVVLNCEVNTEGAKAKWLKNDDTVFESSKFVVVQRDNVFSLRIRDAQKGDEANYSINLTNHRGEHAKSACNLTKKTVSFTCKVNRPNATLKWMKGGEEIVFSKRIVYRVDKDKHTLTIKDCTLADEGEYTAVAGDNKSTAELIIIGPTFDLSAFKDGLEVIVPQPLTIRVPITGYPTPVAKWTFGEKELTTADERVSLMTKSTFTELMVTPSVRPDKGIYTLHLENDVTSVSGEIEDFKVLEVTRQHVHLSWEAPEHDGGSPLTGYQVEKRDMSLQDLEFTVTDVVEGKEYLFRVTACNKCGPGEPAYIDEPVNVSSPNLRWRDKSASGIFLTWEPPKYDGGSSIRGYNVDRCQRGTDKWEPCGDMVPELKCQVTGLIEGQWYAYRVRALNRLGAGRPCKATDEIQAVDPKEPPEIQLDAKLLAGLTAKAGSKIELPAEVTGKPEPRVKWTKADLVLKPDDRVTIDTKPGHSTVTIAKTKRDDSSTYIIEATNSSGRATATVDVNILDKPGPPAAFDISEITNETCFLAWNPPRDDGGSRVTNYIVERRATDSEIWHRLSSTIKHTTYKAVDLVKFKEYIFRVFAENQFGVGPPAEHLPIIARYPFGRSPDRRTDVWCLNLRLAIDNSHRGTSSVVITDSFRADHGVYMVKVENDHGIASATCEVNVLGENSVLSCYHLFTLTNHK
uniref:Immunoglobulin like and fibronectin type III domain containing 1, tandem duplicate 2 n=1 Tax=Seriola dumerili TaxID=41447 RepID=A0A3B4TD88_SERDU